MRTIHLALERTLEQDPKYPIRLLVDIAIKALSPAINDPTTAVQAIDQIENLLRRLGGTNWTRAMPGMRTGSPSHFPDADMGGLPGVGSMDPPVRLRFGAGDAATESALVGLAESVSADTRTGR